MGMIMMRRRRCDDGGDNDVEAEKSQKDPDVEAESQLAHNPYTHGRIIFGKKNRT